MTHPFEQFQQIYIINLASRVDRRNEMQEQLQRIGLSLQSPCINLFEAVRPENSGGFQTVGTRGCFLSHLGVLQHSVANGFESILILEDDLNFSVDFMSRGVELLKQLAEKDWAIFYGGYEVEAPELMVPGCSLLPADMPVATTHFVGLRGRSIADMAVYLSAMLSRAPGHPEGGPMHVDAAYYWFRRAHPQRQTFICVPELGYQRFSRTDIHELLWYDRLPLVRDVVPSLRWLKNRWAKPTNC